MTLMWLAFAVLLLPALWLLVAPLRRAAALYDAQREFEATDRTAEQNVAIYQRRLASLEAALERGEIDAARFEEDRLELERNLLDDTAALKRQPLKAASSGKLLVPVAMIGLVVAAIGWYQVVGASGDLALYQAQREVLDSPDGNVDTLIGRLEEEASRQPGNFKVWRSLYPLYRDSGRISEARAALERLIELEGRQIWLLAELAELRYFTEGRTISGAVQSLVDEVLASEPAQPKVLSMLGIEAFENGDHEQAIEHWRRAIAGMDNPDAAEALRQGIRVAQQRLGIAPDAAEEIAAMGPGVTLRLSLDPSLSERLPDGASVFVVARDTAGELPPLAVQRTTLGELPLTLTLNDSHAMAPSARLSQVERAHLVVRVSKSGQATPQPGDLMGRLEDVTVGRDEPLALVIDRVVE
ncbi:c-type cytochrome biogenesis protein CcmI [Halomonas sp. H10-9-1]|uniref:c-type cytochrome biogenesis protein CcmI n=1 Tax=Halomonas sp. H10-9-1 TaxID=2950871 RepID=UPI0032E04F06